MRSQVVLLVDDEIDIVELVGEALEDLGFEVVTARSGVEALGQLAAGRPFDFVVTDVSMPGGVSGTDLARRARELHPQARLIVASGHPRAHLPEVPVDVEFLPKPYRLGQLLDLLQPS
ncbi:response regulator [Luteimonas composti]|uniref:Response regulator n=1 Tax=Luteimonas composti TaxID=398257 RepID=A0ABT6MNR9_9GAMM|nr:response regulator [Luteimonas composti]MDH7452241.1 response regulator [Luteimonas composti]